VQISHKKKRKSAFLLFNFVKIVTIFFYLFYQFWVYLNESSASQLSIRTMARNSYIVFKIFVIHRTITFMKHVKKASYVTNP